MAAKSILKDTKAPLLFLRSSFLAAAVPKTTSPNTQLIQSIPFSNQKPLPHLSSLPHYLYQHPPSPMVDGFRLGKALEKLQARGSDDDVEKEDDGSGVEFSDDEDYGDFDSDDVSDGEDTDSEE